MIERPRLIGRGGILRAGKKAYADDRAGFWLGVDRAGTAQIDIGNAAATRYLRWTGADLIWKAAHTQLEADGTLSAVNGYFSGVLDASILDIELMKISFQSISWAQFAVYETFADSTNRASPDPSTYDATILRGKLYNGGETQVSRAHGYRAKTWTNITTIYSGTSTAVASGYLQDDAARWYADQYNGQTLVDSAGVTFTIIDTQTTTHKLTVSGTPAAGAYTIRTALPAYLVAFCSYSASDNGGYGHLKFELSFDAGVNFQTVLDTENGLDYLMGITAIDNPGRAYTFRLTLKNDTAGRGPEVYRLLFCTDPSPWS